MNSTPAILFRADAGPNIGLGHLKRSLSLACAVRQEGTESIFLVNPSAKSREFIERSGFVCHSPLQVEPWTPEDASATLKVAGHLGSKVVVVDSHQVSAEYLAQLRQAGLMVVAKDDLARYPFPCQMVVNGNADANKLRYASSSGDTVFLLGTDYMVLGQEFWDWCSRADDRPVQNVLVTLGGTDDYNLMPQILETLDQLPGEFTLTAIIGPYFKHAGEVEKVASLMSREVKLAHSPPSLQKWMAEADLAVSAAGQTLYELARAGCPTVAFSVALNQEGQLAALEEAGLLRSAGSAARDDVIAGVGQVVSSLLGDPSSRSRMAAAGRRLVDGKGALRVAQAIVDEIRVSAKGHAPNSRNRVS